MLEAVSREAVIGELVAVSRLRCILVSGQVLNLTSALSLRVKVRLKPDQAVKKPDQVRFFSIAFGSVRECQSLLIIANQQEAEVYSLLDKVAASLYLLIKKGQ